MSFSLERVRPYADIKLAGSQATVKSSSVLNAATAAAAADGRESLHRHRKGNEWT